MARKMITELDMNSDNKIINLKDPTTDQDAATKKWVDDNFGGSNVRVVVNAGNGTEVFSGSSPTGGFDDLDLSSFDSLSTNKALVYLKIYWPNSNEEVVFRVNGDTEITTIGAYAYSVHGIYTVATKFHTVIVPTDSNGVCEWNSSVARTCTIDLVGYIAAG